MGRNRTEYMRAYRARQKVAAEPAPKAAAPVAHIVFEETVRDLLARNEALEAEVRRLKQELARRPPVPMVMSPPVRRMVAEMPHSFGAPRPAPKPGHH